MKKQLLKSALIAVAGVGLLAGSAMADELTLQEVLDTYTNTGLQVGVNESGVEAWTLSEANADAYLISLLSAAEGSLYIYNPSTPATGYLLGIFDGITTAANFGINNANDLYINNALAKANFGDTFAFYWQTANGKSYTQNENNQNDNVLALTYLVGSGYQIETQLNGGTTINSNGNNDWIIAFEDWTDADFQDAVLYFEDMNAVPEPTTMLLFGTGLLGLATAARRRMNS